MERRLLDSPFGPIEAKPYQIIVRVKLRVEDLLTAAFPAVLDTGFNHNLSITEQHVRLLGVEPKSLETTGYMRVLTDVVPLQRAELLLEDEKLVVPSGIAVWENNGPRIPLLGMRALMQSKLRLVVDGRRSAASIGPSRWYH